MHFYVAAIFFRGHPYIWRTTVRHDITAVASGPAGPVLARPVFTVVFETAHAQSATDECILNTKLYRILDSCRACARVRNN